MRRMLTVLALCAATSGCSRIQEAMMPVAAKINAAYPLSADVRIAQERLLAMLAADGTALELATGQLESRLTLRALACAKSARVGRTDSIATVKALALNQRCFQDQDKEVAQFLGLRSVGVLLGQTALRPAKPLGPATLIPSGNLSQVSGAIAAAQAGVAVLRGQRGDFSAVEIPGGAPISSLPSMQQAYGNVHVSPNGRVVVLPIANQGMTFVDVESGSRLLELPDGGQFIAWLPEVGSIALSNRESALTLLDLQSGSIEPHPLGLRQMSWSIRAGEMPARVLIGASNEVNAIEHTRTAEGVRAQVIKQYKLPTDQSMSAATAKLMRDGKLLVFANTRNDLGWLNLESGDSGLWKLNPYFQANGIGQVDQTHVLIDSIERDSYTRKTWSFDVDSATVAPVDLGVAGSAAALNVGDRLGFMRRGNGVWVGDTVRAGEPIAVAKLMADYELEMQMARLKAQAQAAEIAAAAAASPTPPPAPAYASGLPQRGDVATIATVPGLGDVPRDAQVHVVGVYQGDRIVSQSVPGHPMRDVRVNVRSSAKPVVLVLASYEPVRWTVVNQGARVSAVLMSGYHPSSIVGAGGAPVIRIGSAHAYSAASAEYVRLRQAVTQYAGAREIRSFQGSYTGAEFSVGP